MASFGSGRTAGYRLDLPIAGLRPGEYLLTILAEIAGQATRRDVRFRVR
jgi:hypothetical protein